MKKLLILAAVAGFLFCARAHAACPGTGPATGFTTCRYVDVINGSDSNDGLSEASGHPWKHGPGMTGAVTGGDGGCSSTCAAFTPSAGTAIVYKGGEVAPYTMFPFNWAWSGSSTTTTTGFGCAGTGCILAITYDPGWNLGQVNSILPTGDTGGCGATGATVAITGGGGSSAAASVTMVGGITQFAGGQYLTGYYTISNAGTGYTSDPTVAVTCSGQGTITAKADIFHVIFDLGLGSFTWTYSNANSCSGTPALQIGVITDGCSAHGTYTRIDGLTIRNFQWNNTGASCSPNCEPVLMKFAESQNITFNDVDISNFFGTTQSTASADGSEILWIAYNSATPSGEISNSIVTDGQQTYSCTPSTTTLCSWGSEGAIGGNYLHGDNVSYTVWEYAASGESSTTSGQILQNSVGWANNASNVGGHTDLVYLLGIQSGTTVVVSDNLFYNEDAGAFSQMGSYRGVTWWVYNNTCSQYCGGSGGNSFVIDATCGGSCGSTGTATINFDKNSVKADSNGYCLNLGSGGAGGTYSAMALNMYDNMCITSQSLSHWYFANSTQPNTINGITSPSNTTADSANYIPSSNPSGFTQANFLNPTGSGAPTQTGATNLTSSATGLAATLTGDNNNPGAQYTTTTLPSTGSGNWTYGPAYYMGGVTVNGSIWSGNLVVSGNALIH